MGNHFSSLTCSQWSDLGATYAISDDRVTSFWSEFGNGVVPRNVIVDAEGVVRYNAIGFNETAINAVFDELLTITSAEAPVGQPQSPLLLTSYPNPFNAGTQLRYQIAETGPVALHIYDASGRSVFSSGEAAVQPGAYSFSWFGTDNSGVQLPSGVYIARLETSAGNGNLKLLLLK